jgi:chemotaxis response regulator CheB
VRVGILADDAATAETLLKVVLSMEDTRAAWTAVSGSEALALCLSDPVDLVLLDMELGEPAPALVERLQRDTASAILLITGTDGSYTSEVFEALRHGAVDVVVAPVAGGGDPEAGTRELVEKLGRVKRLLEGPDRSRRRRARGTMGPPLVIIGASTGGPEALATVLGGLPREFPAPIVTVQHLDEKFTEGMIEWLGSATSLVVVPAIPGGRPQPGRVSVATGNLHVTLGADGTFLTSAEPRDVPYRPSVDVFCRSAADHWHGLGTAVLLTGLGRDGGAGLLALRRAGWHTMAQDRSTSAVFGMPREASRMGAAAEVLPLTGIAPALVRRLAATNGGHR